MWKYENNELNQDQLLVNESLFTLANGYLGIRGCFEEGYKNNLESIRGTYINGFHEIVDVQYGEKLCGFPEIKEKQLNLIDAQSIKIYLDYEEVSLFKNSHEEYKRQILFDQGLSERRFKYKTQSGKKAEIIFQRIVSFKTKELFIIHVKVIYDGKITVISSVDANVENYTDEFDPRVGHRHSKLLYLDKSFIMNDKMMISAKTQKSNLSVLCGTTHSCFGEDVQINIGKESEDFLYSLFQGKNHLEVTKYTVYTNSRHHKTPEADAVNLLDKVILKDFDTYKIQQQEYLKQFWKDSDISIFGDDKLQQGIRFSIFHFLQSVGKDGITNISAKGLSGEGYEGHYFWDTEIYVLPVLQLTQPQIARQLLIYRYKTLEEARKRARILGHRRGVKFPWRTITGIECSTFFPAGTAQYHINGDVAYSFIQDYLYHQDLDFMSEYGAEVLFETARLWLDIGHFNDGKFVIHTVTGPDEYTCLVNNNYYTNLLAQYNIKWAVLIYELLKKEKTRALKEIIKEIKMDESEIQDMKDAFNKMYLPYDEELGINMQDDSFLMKKKWDFENTSDDKYPLLLHYHPLTIYRHQVIKQPDTVLAHFLLEDYARFEEIKRSYDYYEKLTTHDSSLSSCIHGIMASKCGYYDKAYEYFLQSLNVDLENTHGNTKDGLHIANLAGVILSMVFGFGGYRIKENGICFSPWKPDKWDGYEFKVMYRGRLLKVSIFDDISIEVLKGDEVTVKVYDEVYVIKDMLTIPLRRQ